MKQYFRYQIDFSGKWINFSVICMAISFFATMVYYFGLINLLDCSFGEILFSMILPVVLSFGYVFLLKIKQLNAPGIFGIIGAVFCLTILIGCFFSGNAVRIMLGIVWYLCCGLLILACVGGYLPENLPVTVVFAVAIFVRLLLFHPSLLQIGSWIKELATLFALAAFMLLPLGLKAGRTKT